MKPGHRSPLRILAPATLVVFGLALVIVIASGAGSGSGGGGDDHPTKLEQQDLGAKKRSSRALAKGVYTVKANDTYGSIAEKTGVPVDTLIQLNPDVDPQSLHEGQKIKLR